MHHPARQSTAEVVDTTKC